MFWLSVAALNRLLFGSGRRTASATDCDSHYICCIGAPQERVARYGRHSTAQGEALGPQIEPSL